MFTDEAEIFVQAGHGGLGGKHYLREKYKPMGGPAGGDGGAGGSIYIVARTGISSLYEFKFRKEFTAPNGENGMRNKMAGRDGANITIDVPCGTIIYDKKTKKKIIDLVQPDEPFLLAKGGKGGLGNYHFATSRNQSPKYSQPGLPGEEFEIFMELKLIADIGLVGLPNAGKSTLLKALTNANPKIGAYPFTTLHPNLGVLPVYEKAYVVADIPGLIEGASKGVGLGDEFLRHIERTKYILHVVDMSGMSGDPYQNYVIINKELAAYSKKLAKKEQLLVLNKTDVPESAEYIAQFLKQAGKVHHVAISAAANQNIEELKKNIAKLFIK